MRLQGRFSQYVPRSSLCFVAVDLIRFHAWLLWQYSQTYFTAALHAA